MKRICRKRLFPYAFIPIPTVKSIAILLGIVRHFYRVSSVCAGGIVNLSVNYKFHLEFNYGKTGSKSHAKNERKNQGKHR